MIQEICVLCRSGTAWAAGWLRALWQHKMLPHSLYCVLLSVTIGTPQDIEQQAAGPVQWPVSDTEYKNVILSTARDKYHSQPLFLLPVVSTTARFLPASGEKAASHSFSLYQLSSWNFKSTYAHKIFQGSSDKGRGIKQREWLGQVLVKMSPVVAQQDIETAKVNGSMAHWGKMDHGHQHSLVRFPAIP